MALGKQLGVKECFLLQINGKSVFNTAGSAESEEEEGAEGIVWEHKASAGQSQAQ